MLTFSIQVKVDFDDPDEKVPLVHQLLRTKAKEIGATLNFIKDRRAPQVAITGSDYFVSPEQIAIMVAEDGDDAD
jgi:hypothetical protein